MPLPIYDTSTTQAAPLGDELHVATNRVYRYAKNSSAPLAAGTIVQASRPNSSHENLTCAATAVKDTSITVTLGTDAVDTDEYKGGYIFTNDQAGEGYVYDILSHPWAEPSATLKLSIRDGVVVALTTSSQATLVKNVYDGVNRPYGDPWDIICGVAPVAVPANEYFWCQVRGPAAVLQAGNLFAGRGVMLSQWKPGAVEALKQVVSDTQARAFERRTADAEQTGHIPSEHLQFQQKGVEMGSVLGEDYLTSVSGMASIPERVIGYCITPRVSTEYALVYLTIS